MSLGAVRSIAVVASALFALSGAWAFLDPRGFYDTVATYPPFNEHLFHDLGAFQIGLAAGLLAGLRWDKGLSVGLAGAGAGALSHAISHVMDTDLGGRSTDPLALGAFATLLLVALVVHLRRDAS